MGSVWSGKNEWSLRSLGSSARKVIGLRRPVTADRAVWFPNRRRPVRLSEWRGVLDALSQLPTIAAGRGGWLPADSPAALNKSSERVRLAAAGAGAGRARSVQSTKEGGEG